MNAHTIREYHAEVEAFFNNLTYSKPKILEGLGVTDDLEGFEKELMMIGLEKLRKDIKKE